MSEIGRDGQEIFVVARRWVELLRPNRGSACGYLNVADHPARVVVTPADRHSARPRSSE